MMRFSNLLFLALCGSSMLDGVGAQGDALVEPTVISSSGGELDITLTIDYATITGDFFTLTNARLLNGLLPGPTLSISAGDVVKINFVNNLEQQDGTTFNTNEFTKPDYSNIHFHGGHVSGELPSDDVKVPIAPGSSYQYETTFPSNHMGGTHWLHPHVHGSSSLQVGGGAALALIVKDEAGDLPAQITAATEVVLMVQHMKFSTLNSVINSHNDGKMSVSSSDLTDFRLVNGQFQPVISMQPGEWQRWRIIWGGWLINELDFQFSTSDCEMQLLAKDGIYIPDFPRSINILPLAAGGRADVMVRCPTAGTYTVEDYSRTLLTVSVSGTTVASDDMAAFDPVYPAYLTDLTSTSPTSGCSCTTDIRGCGNDRSRFCINGELFNENSYLHTIEYGSVVQRVLEGIDKHPYHQHVYPVQIVALNRISGSIYTNFYKVGDWADVIQMNAETVTVRYKADVHDGTIMVHCHILTHEDEGTMTQELVSADETCSCTSAGGGGGGGGGGGFPCFSADVTTTVREKGLVAMKDLQVGDEVLTASGSYQPIYAMDHFHRSKPTEFLQIHTTMADEKPLEVTSLHMIFVKGQANPIPAQLVKVGDFIQTIKSEGPHEVTSIEKVTRNGFYNVLTTDGTIVVNGIVGSAYPALMGGDHIEAFGMKLMSQQSFVHMALSPIRALCSASDITQEILCKNYSEDAEEYFSWYSQLHNLLFHAMEGQHEVVQGLMMGAAVLLLSVLSMLSFCVLENPQHSVLAVTFGAAMYRGLKK